MNIKWFDAPEAHNYPAAESYLTLLFSPKKARRIVERLVEAPISSFKSRDIFRASRLPLLGLSNARVHRDQEKIMKGKSLSPILLVRRKKGLIIADGYHRMCAVYTFDQDAMIPCKIV